MWPFRKNEIRENEQPQVQPYIDKPTDACTEVNQGVGLLNKLLNLKGYDALSQSPFFAAVNLISSSVGQMHWEVKSKTDEEIPSNMYANIKDFGLLTQFMLVKNIIKDAILSGNGFAYIHRDKSGKPISLEYLPTSEISIRYNPITKILYYMIPNKNNMLVEPINVIHVLMHSKNGVEGHSLLSFATNTIKLSGNAEKAASEFFSNGMNVHGILSTDSPRQCRRQHCPQQWSCSIAWRLYLFSRC